MEWGKGLEQVLRKGLSQVTLDLGPELKKGQQMLI